MGTQKTVQDEKELSTANVTESTDFSAELQKISDQINSASNELNELKNSAGKNLSDDEKKKKAQEIEKTILDCNTSLSNLESSNSNNSNQAELQNLKTRINNLQTEYNNTANELGNLRENVEQGEKKGFTGWCKEQRSELTTKEGWKEHPVKNTLRAVGGVGLIGGTIWLGRKIFGRKDYEDEIPGYNEMSKREKRRARRALRSEKRRERRENHPGLYRFLTGTATTVGIGSGVYYLAHGIYTKNRRLKDLFDRERGKKLKFEEAMDYCKGAIANQEGMASGMDLKFHEDTSEIEAYGEKIKVDISKNGKIEGLDIKFKRYEHMISTAILIAYLKKEYTGKCSNNAPFCLNGSLQGDINVNTVNGQQEAVDGTGNGGKIAGVTAGGIAGIVSGIFAGPHAGISVGVTGGILGLIGGSIFDANNIMHDHMPELDDDAGRKKLSGYLNNLNCRQSRNQGSESITESPIKDKVWAVIKEIQETNPDLPNMGGERDYDAVPDPNNPNKYTIKAWGRNISAEVTGTDGNEKIKILGISGGHPAIIADMGVGNIGSLNLPLREGIFMTCLIGHFIKNFEHKGNSHPYFKYTSRLGFRKGLYFSDKYLDTYALTDDKFKDNTPTLYKEENRENFIKFLNDGIKGDNNVSIFKE